MFWVTKRVFRKDRKALKETIDKMGTEIQTNEEDIDKLEKELAMINGQVSVLLSSPVKSQVSVPSRLKLVSDTFEDKIVKKIRQTKKQSIMNVISKSLSSKTTTQLFNFIVLEKKLCSKASFYRYISQVRKEKSLNSSITETPLNE